MGKYEEALAKARFEYEQNLCASESEKSLLEIIFPELKESKDKQIIDALTKRIQDMYDNETAIYEGVQVSDILAWLEKQKEPHFTKRNALFDECVAKCDPAIMKKVSDEVDEMLGKEQKSAEDNFANNESEYDKGYREGHRFGLKQTQEYMLSGGKTFSGLIPCWVNAPSELQPAHKYHGKNVVVMHENNGGFKCTCIDDERATTFHLPENTLFVEGWRKKPAEWSDEDESILRLIHEALSCAYSVKNMDAQTCSVMREWLNNRVESLRPQPHWKPSEEQMEALMWQIKNTSEGSWQRRASEDLYNQLKKL